MPSLSASASISAVSSELSRSPITGSRPPSKGRPLLFLVLAFFFGSTTIDPDTDLWFNHKTGLMESSSFPPALTRRGVTLMQAAYSHTMLSILDAISPNRQRFELLGLKTCPFCLAEPSTERSFHGR